MSKSSIDDKLKKHLMAVVRYKRDEIVYDEFAYKRMQNAYRQWLKNIIKYGCPEPKIHK